MSYYRVLLNGIDIYDPLQLPLTFISPRVVCGLSDAGSFDFVMPKGHIFYNGIVPYGSTIEVFEDGQSIFYGRPTLPKIDFYGNKQVHCEGALAFLNDVIVPPIKVSGGAKITMKEYIEILFEHYNKTCRREDRKLILGTVNLASDQEAKHTWNYETCFDILKQGILPYTGSYTVTRRALGVTYIDFVYRFNSLINQPIKLASNLLDMTKTGQEFYTAVMAKGASDAVQMLSPMLADNALIQKYGFICAFKEYPNCETITDLQMQCSVFLKSQQFSGMRFEASATDLHLENSAYQQFVVGAVTKIDSPFHDFASNFRATISKIEINLDTGEKNATLLTLTQQILTIVDTEDYQYQFSEYNPDYDYKFPDDYDYFFEIVSLDDLEWEPIIYIPDEVDPSKFIGVEWPEGEDPPIGDEDEILIKRPVEDIDDLEEGTKIVTPLDPDNPSNLDDIIGDQPKPISAVDDIISNTPTSETPTQPGNYNEFTPIKGEDGNSYVVKVDENGDVEATKIPDNLELTDGTNPIDSITMNIGDTFDPSDITPQLKYGDGTTVPAENVQYNIPNGYEFTGDDSDPDWLTALITDPNIKITYTETIPINKETRPPVVSIAFSSTPSKAFKIGDAFSLLGYSVIATRADGSSFDVTGNCQYSLTSGYVFRETQPNTLTAMYKDGEKWFSTNTTLNFADNYVAVRIGEAVYYPSQMTGYSQGQVIYGDFEVEVLEGDYFGLYYNGSFSENYAPGEAHKVRYEIEVSPEYYNWISFTSSPRQVVIEGKRTNDDEWEEVATVMIQGSNVAALYYAGLI